LRQRLACLRDQQLLSRKKLLDQLGQRGLGNFDADGVMIRAEREGDLKRLLHHTTTNVGSERAAACGGR
jgi:hypothetical protein